MAVSDKAQAKSFPRGKTKPKTESAGHVDEKKQHREEKRTRADEDDLFHVTRGVDANKSDAAKKKRKKSSKDEAKTTSKDAFEVGEAEPLQYSDLCEGLIVLCRVSRVDDYELRVSMPGRLVATAAIGDVSKPYTKQLKKLAGVPDDADAAESSVPVRPLADMFYVGQTLVATVTRVDKTEDGFNKIGVSLTPQSVQGSLPPAALKKGTFLQAAVQSIEDHGLIMDVGVAGVKAFLSNKKLKKYISDVLNGENPSVGQLIPTMVTRNDLGSVTLTAVPHKLRSSHTEELTNASTHTLRPGAIVKATMEKAIRQGVKVAFEHFTGFVHNDHLSEEAKECGEGEELTLRVLYILPTVNRIYLSSMEHLQFAARAHDPIDKISIGATVEEAKVVVVGSRGLRVQLVEADASCVGFIALSQLPEAEKEEGKAKNAKQKYPVGSKLTCRIIQYDYCDHVFVCSAKRAVLKQTVLQASQLVPGDKVGCVVKGFVKGGVVVEIGKNAEAFIPEMHLSDAPLKHPEKKFPPGTKLQCRVLRVDPSKRKLHLTNKSILVKNEYPVVASFDPSQVGVVTEGVVVSISNQGLLLQLFGEARGWVPKSLISTEPVEYPEKLFFTGQVLRCQVYAIDVEAQKMTLSLIIGGRLKPIGTKQKKEAERVTLGLFYDCTVKEIGSDGLNVEIESAGCKAFVPKNHLSDHVSLADALLASYAVGERIESALCFERDVVPILSLKASLAEAVRSETLPSSFADLTEGVVVPGVVTLIKSYGVFLRLPTWKFRKSALVPMRHLANFFVEDPSEYVTMHQTLYGKVIERNEDEQKVTMSAKLKDMARDPEQEVRNVELLLRDVRRLIERSSCSGLAAHSVGSLVTCTVKNCTSLGVEVDVNGIRGIITNFGLTGLPNRPKEGDFLSAVVLFVDWEFGCLELTAQPDIVKKVTLACKKGPRPDTTVKAIAVLTKSELGYILLCVKAPHHLAGRLIHVSTRHHINDQTGFANLFNLGESYSVLVKSEGEQSIGILQKDGKAKRSRKESLSGASDTVPQRKRTISQTSTSSTANSVDSSKRVRKDSEVSEVSMHESLPSEAEDKEEKGEEDRQGLDPGWSDDFNPWVKSEEGEKAEAASTAGAKRLKTHLSKKEKKELDRLEAEEIARAEQRILDGEVAEPTTIDEFERLVLASPDSSLCWIKYMAFHLEKKEMSKAREVVKRALEKIGFREEEERLNLYMAWLNLEVSFGDEESTTTVLTEATKFNDEYKVLTRAASTFEQSGKVDKAEAIFKKLVSKFSREPEAWTMLGLFYFKRKDLSKARFTLQRSIQTLEKKHHVDMTVRFAQMEFKHGETERGKTIFETVLGSYPKRTDIWSVYVDMLVKHGELNNARLVFERMIELNLQPKKMKFLFKKYLEFEEQHGDQHQVDQVRKKALAYVEAKVGLD